jgi:hypothetical protein
MAYATGQTIYEQVVSVDQSNTPISGATFDTVLYKDGAASAISVTTSLYDATRAIFAVSFVPDDYGLYQLYMKNSLTDVIFISDIYDVSSAGTLANIYVGL